MASISNLSEKLSGKALVCSIYEIANQLIPLAEVMQHLPMLPQALDQPLEQPEIILWPHYHAVRVNKLTSRDVIIDFSHVFSLAITQSVESAKVLIDYILCFIWMRSNISCISLI